MAATTTVAAVGAAFGHIFGTVKMARTRTALARTAKDFDIIYEIRIWHGSMFVF